MRAKAVLIVAGAAIVAAAVALVVLSLRAPAVAMYAPTPPTPREVGGALVGPLVYTVDATRPEPWRYFAFHLGSVIENPGARDWDLAFRRYEIIANGGPSFAGAAGILDLGAVPFPAVKVLPESGYQVTEGAADPRNPALARWYSYGYFSHLLTPRPSVWAVRTADGRYAKIEIVSYYCPGSRPGCVTFRYVYQGDGSRNVDPARAGPRSGKSTPRRPAARARHQAPDAKARRRPRRHMACGARLRRVGWVRPDGIPGMARMPRAVQSRLSCD